MEQGIVIDWKLIVGVIASLSGVISLLFKIVMDRMNIIVANCEAERKKTIEETTAQVNQYKEDLRRVNDLCDKLQAQVTVLTGKVSYYEGLNAKNKKR